MYRSMLAAAGVLVFAAACSDPTTGPSAVTLNPSFIDGPSPNIGAVQLTYLSGADPTDYCGKTADNTWNPVPIPCTTPVLAPITTINPGWTATIPGAQWVSWIPNGDRYLSPSASYTYRRTFVVPSDATDPVLNVNVAADNGVTVWLNGTQIGATATNQNIFANVQTYSATTGFIIGGVNEILFVVENTRVPSLSTGLPTAIGQPCPTRPHAKNTAGTGLFYDEDPGYDPVACYNPTGLLYQAAISWDIVVRGGEGCSPGYWKNHDFPEGYSKNTLFDDVFENAFPGMTLQQVLEQGGGGLNALGRQTVSAYFNALTVNYEYTPQEVVNMFNAVFPGGDYNTLKNTFESLTDVNGRICGNPTGN